MSEREQRESEPNGTEPNGTEHIAEEISGYTEDSLLAEFQAAEQEVRELQNKSSLWAERGLEELKERIHKLELCPIYQADYDKRNTSEDLKRNKRQSCVCRKYKSGPT